MKIAYIALFLSILFPFVVFGEPFCYEYDVICGGGYCRDYKFCTSENTSKNCCELHCYIPDTINCYEPRNANMDYCKVWCDILYNGGGCGYCVEEK